LPEDHLRDDLRKRALAPLINRTIAVSTAIAEHLTRRWGYRPSRVAVIPNGVDLDLFRGPDPEIRARARHRLGVDGDAFLVGSVGRLEAQKGFVHLIRAAGALAGAAPDLRLAIAGEGSLAGALRDEARALAIGDRLLLAGRVDDAAEFLAALDLFVLPSLWEGMPLSLLEAMAMGVPCVATATAGSAEVLAVADAEPAGDTVPPADERALAAAIAAHRRDRERSRRVGRAGLARVRERHDAARLFDRLVSLYDELAPPAAS
jgi:glycosyltransferase involved in cell wall biosynthesis